MNILIMESDLSLKTVMKIACLDFGYNATCASTCNDAFFKLSANHYDLIISDILLDGVYIDNVLKYFLWRNPEKAAVIVTGLDPWKRELLPAEISKYYLTKPFGLLDFKITVDRALNLR